MTDLDKKLNKYFPGKVVRKDLTSLVKGNASIPTYVLEYLLGQYCATDEEETIEQGIKTVQEIISRHFVHRDEAQIIKSTVREKGSHRIIDKVEVKLNDKLDRYEATFSNLGLRNVPISDNFIKKHPKLLAGGVWSITTLGYFPSDERNHVPWVIEKLKPIQVAHADMDEYIAVRAEFSKEEWIDLIIQSIGLNPAEFTHRSKLIQLSRLIPFTENNYNIIELGPKGTGKSHIYSELSPHGILISGGEVTKAKLFVNNSTGDIGLVGYWDVVAYDEFAGRNKKADRGLVDILKNYMANKSFSRGTQVYQAEASMVYVGNTDHSVPYMLKHSDLFEALPQVYYDSAFLDRIHCYLPGWEVQKLRNEMFTSEYGFIVDYLAEVLKSFRKKDFTNLYRDFFELSDTITTRDKTSIEKTFAGLAKVIYPDGNISEEDTRELLDFAIEGRKRVKDQLRKMDETFNDEVVLFEYKKQDGKLVKIQTLEVLEYGDEKLGIKPASFVQVEENEDDDSSSYDEKKEKTKVKAVEGQKIIFENQTGITYEQLFKPYLVGAEKIVVIDPYIRLPYQLKNFMEFARLVAQTKSAGEEVELHLITNNNEDYIQNAKTAFAEMRDSMEPVGIKFSYEFNDSIHDRSIVLDNGWKIVLGRGLDIYQKTNGWFDIADHYQNVRQCKGCEITYLRDEE